MTTAHIMVGKSCGEMWVCNHGRNIIRHNKCVNELKTSKSVSVIIKKLYNKGK